VAETIRPEDDTAGLSCQLCRREAERGDDWAVDSAAGDPVRVRTTITVSTETGEEDGYRESVRRFVICGECWDAKLQPWFAAQGAAPTLEES
jgi:hypothetical protein